AQSAEALQRLAGARQRLDVTVLAAALPHPERNVDAADEVWLPAELGGHLTVDGVPVVGADEVTGAHPLLPAAGHPLAHRRSGLLLLQAVQAARGLQEGGEARQDARLEGVADEHPVEVEAHCEPRLVSFRHPLRAPTVTPRRK